MRDHYKSFVQLANKAAKLNGKLAYAGRVATRGSHSHVGADRFSAADSLTVIIIYMPLQLKGSVFRGEKVREFGRVETNMSP